MGEGSRARRPEFGKPGARSVPRLSPVVPGSGSHAPWRSREVRWEPLSLPGRALPTSLASLLSPIGHPPPRLFHPRRLGFSRVQSSLEASERPRCIRGVPLAGVSDISGAGSSGVFPFFRVTPPKFKTAGELRGALPA